MRKCLTCDNEAKKGGYCQVCGDKLLSSDPEPKTGTVTKTRDMTAEEDRAKPLASKVARFPVLVRLGQSEQGCRERWLGPGEFALGRTAKDWAIPDDPKLSALHATLTVAALDKPRKDQAVWTVAVRDAKSTNGTFRRVSERIKITSGLRVMLGNSLLTWSAAEGAAVGAGTARHTQEFSAKSAPIFSVKVNGPGGEETVPIHGQVTIGGKGAKLRLDDPCVSERHAQLVERDEGYFLEDRGSKNGTYADIGVEMVELKDQDCLRMGGQLFRLEFRLV